MTVHVLPTKKKLPQLSATDLLQLATIGLWARKYAIPALTKVSILGPYVPESPESDARETAQAALNALPKIPELPRAVE